MSNIVPVVLAGGVGRRLWPLSSRLRPKQFLPLISGGSLLQRTARRVIDRSHFKRLLVVANAEHEMLAREQLSAIDGIQYTLIIEPDGKNTAPAVAAAALVSIEDDPNSILLMLPTDHHIGNEESLATALEHGLSAADMGWIVLLGIEPTAPKTGYGYIRAGGAIDGYPACHKVVAFHEKPDVETAETLIASGGCFWNSGIVLASAKTLLAELEHFQPDLLGVCQAAVRSARGEANRLYLAEAEFVRAPSISIDHAVMEKTGRAVVVPANLSWIDIGTWSALWELGAKTPDANVVLGAVELYEAKNCYFRSEGLKITALGVQNLIVVATNDGILVMNKESEQHLKLLLDDQSLPGGAA